MVFKYELVNSTDFLNWAGNCLISTEDLESIFIKTSQILSKELHKAKCLLYPGKPREHECKQVMSTVLSEFGYNHMVERPIKNPLLKRSARRDDAKNGNDPLKIDMAIYTKVGIIDIEFKRKLDDIERDFPKLFASTAVGCAIFYIFQHESIDYAIQKFILKKYQTVYEKSRDASRKNCLLREKWFRFGICAYREGRLFSKHYDSITKVNFYEVAKNEIGISHMKSL